MTDPELTIEQAPDELIVSVEFVTGLIDACATPCRMFGNRPILLFPDVTCYKSEIDAKRRAVLGELTSVAQ